LLDSGIEYASSRETGSWTRGEESAYNDNLALKAEEVFQMIGFGNWNRHDGGLIDKLKVDGKRIDSD
jgi:hypothetical protein